MKYNYLESIKADIKTYLEDEFEYRYSNYEDKDELQETLRDDLWTEDSVTGNASGSYTFDRAEAEEYVKENLALCIEACEEFCIDHSEFGKKIYDDEWEYLDVTIRCYLLGQAIAEVLEEIEM